MRHTLSDRAHARVQAAATSERMLHDVSAELTRLSEHNAAQAATLRNYGECMAHHCMRVDRLASELSDCRDELAQVRSHKPNQSAVL